MLKIAVLVSGGGTNLQALIDAIQSGKINNAKIATVVSNKEGVYALERAKGHNIPTKVIVKKNNPDFQDQLLEHLLESKVDLIVLAGFMCIFEEKIIKAFPRRIINIHPSLIPSFCGMGYYGLKVHEAALDYGVKVTGATVHYVDNTVDGGEIIAQKAVEVLPGDTPRILQKRVMEQAEHIILPQAVAQICERLQKKGRE